ncbi:MAG: MFS transporter [Candidatus Mycalebacterium zealandia]|nr:MAG: MFS transporter [Candidatus Mycalebacterium zealandia]
MPLRNIHYGWIIVVAAFFLIFLDGLLLYTFGVFKPYLSESVRLSETAVASIFSLRCVTLAISMPLAGKLAEKYKPKYLIIAGGVIASSGVFLSAFADSIFELYIFYGVLVGLGDGAFYTLPVAIISRWFKKNRALAIGIATTGLPVSGLILSPLSAWLIHSFGLREAFFVTAAIVLVISLCGFILRKDPSEMGQSPIGGDSGAVESDPDAGSIRAMDAIRRRDFWILYFVFWAGFNTFLIVIINLYHFGRDSGLDSNAAINMGFFSLNTFKAAIPPALIGVGSIFGRIFFSGYVLRFVQEKRILLMCYILQSGTILFLLFFSDEWAFYLFGFLFGFFYSGWVPIFPTILGNLYGLKELGAIFGFFGSGFSLAALTGPITAGLIKDTFGGYEPMFWVAVCFCFLASAATFFVKSESTVAGGDN